MEVAASIGRSGWSAGSDKASIISMTRSRCGASAAKYAIRTDSISILAACSESVSYSAAAPPRTISDASRGVPRSNSTRARTQASRAKVSASVASPEASWARLAARSSWAESRALCAAAASR